MSNIFTYEDTTIDVNDSKFDRSNEVIDRLFLVKGYNWVQIYYLSPNAKEISSENEKIFKSRFYELTDEDHRDIPGITPNEWHAFVKYKENLSNQCVSTTIPDDTCLKGANDRKIPSGIKSAWQVYKSSLKKLSDYEKGNMEKSAHSILGWLNLGSDLNSNAEQPVKGMVVGCVQSGKTANMLACITMAADYGCNLVIVLTGIIDNLRNQTRKRFIKDLNNKSNVDFKALSNPGDWTKDENVKKDWCEQFYPEPFVKGDRTNQRTCYLCFCLKNSKRLKNLKALLDRDIVNKSNLRILIIDDEADQASLNTNRVDRQEIAAINRNIRNIVNNKNYDEATKKTEINPHPYGAMNYIAFTATPYGNFLNEKSSDSLYPRTFISLLTPSDLYFGPKEIFGLPSEEYKQLPIISKISGIHGTKRKDGTKDIKIIEDICKKGGKNCELPQSLKDALMWFICAVACRRKWNQISPSTMLIHHSMKTDDHLAISEAVFLWLNKQKGRANDFIKECSVLYKKMCSEFSLETFKSNCSWYGNESYKYTENKAVNSVKNYPEFKDISKYIKEIIEQIGHVNIDSKKMIFNSGIHICTDNSKPESLTDQEDSEVNVRLVYPDDENPYQGLSPAFIVVGGNTLSRGLTLEGLVCTYFSRDVKQADTLMQMGRWFGYRVGYELLPRIWMTNEAQTRFEYLAQIDDSLRTELVSYSNSPGDEAKSPEAVAPIISLPVCESMFSITSKTKQQNAVDFDVNLAGSNIQPTIFSKQDLKTNLDAGDNFLNYLEQNYSDSLLDDENESKRVWRNVGFDIIWNKLLEPSAFSLLGLSSKELLKKWMEKVIEGGELTNWNVVLSGKHYSKKDSSSDCSEQKKSWHKVGKVERSRIISGTREEDSDEINLGSISSPNDWHSDFEEKLSKDEISALDKATEESKKTGKRNSGIVEAEKNKIRRAHSLGKTPLIVLYCIDKHSESQNKTNKNKPYRTDLPIDLESDILGIYIRIPGDKTNRRYSKRISMNMIETD